MGSSYKRGGVSSYGTYTGNCTSCTITSCEYHNAHRQGCSRWTDIKGVKNVKKDK